MNLENINSLNKKISALSLSLKDINEKHHEVYVTAESLTAGLIGASIVEIPGSSMYFDRGFITYSNESKAELLDVSEETLKNFGAVSEQTVLQMVQGALNHSTLATIGVSVSGIAGPGGEVPGKPVGTVWMAVQKKGFTPISHRFLFEGSREEVRLKTVYEALRALIALTLGTDDFFKD